MASTMRAFSARTASTRTASAPTRRAVASRKIIQPKALFGLFGGAKKAATGVKVEELQADLIKLVAVGANASPATLLQIQNLAKQLAPASVKGAAKSDQLFGDYEIIFSSTPLAGANPRQVLSAPNKIVESTESKSFGLLTVTTAASGEFKAVGPDTYEVVLTRLESKGGLGGSSAAITARRTETVLFLDDKLRVVKVADEDGETLVVSKRRGAKVGGAAPAALSAGTARKGPVFVEEDDEDEAPAPKKSGTGLVFPSFGKTTSSVATMAEREVRRKLEQDSRAPAKPRLALPAPGASPTARLARPVSAPTKPAVDPKAAAAARAKELEAAKAKAKAEEVARAKARAAEEAARAKAAAEAKAKKEAEEAARAKAAASAKDRAEAERRAAAERAAAIKAQLEELSDEARVASAAARDAAKEAKDVERANTNVLRSVATARQQVEVAATDVAMADAAVLDASKARAAAENALKAALAGLQAAQSKAKAGRK